tara:strand:- start:2773 stop:3063 length:291 start_codon:yes stop_codon:yes gene_type:complete
MPYKVDELNDLVFYQNLISADEDEYLRVRQAYIDDYNENNKDSVRDDKGNLLIFENPIGEFLYEDVYSKVMHSTIVDQLKDDDSIDDILDRDFREL